MNFMKKKLSVLFCLFIGLSLYAQSADVITEMLESKEATFGQVSYLAAVQKNFVDENASYDAAVQALYDNGVIPNLEDPSAPIPLVDIAYELNFSSPSYLSRYVKRIFGGSPSEYRKRLK